MLNLPDGLCSSYLFTLRDGCWLFAILLRYSFLYMLNAKFSEFAET